MRRTACSISQHTCRQFIHGMTTYLRRTSGRRSRVRVIWADLLTGTIPREVQLVACLRKWSRAVMGDRGHRLVGEHGSIGRVCDVQRREVLPRDPLVILRTARDVGREPGPLHALSDGGGKPNLVHILSA